MALSLDTPVPLSKLDAVNIVLESAGQSPTAQLGDGARGSAQEAEKVLATFLMQVLAEEWSFNKDDSMKLSRNLAGEIYLPENLMSFEVTGTSEHLDVAQRGSRLYDRANGTFLFDQDVYVSASLGLGFEEIPQPVRWYITMLAALQYSNQGSPGDPSMRVTSEHVRKAKESMDRFDNKTRKRNLRFTNPHFRRLRRRR